MSFSDALTLAALGGVDSETMHHALERIYGVDPIVGKQFFLPKFGIYVWVSATHFHPHQKEGLVDLHFPFKPPAEFHAGPWMTDLYIGDCWQCRMPRWEFNEMNPQSLVCR